MGLVLRNLSFAICSSEKKMLTNFIPKHLTRKKTIMLPMEQATRHKIVPSMAPNAYPAASSKGSPGIKAIIICKTIIPMKAILEIKPLDSTQFLKASGSEIYFTSGRPTNHPIRPIIIKAKMRAIKASFFLALAERVVFFSVILSVLGTLGLHPALLSQPTLFSKLSERFPLSCNRAKCYSLGLRLSQGSGNKYRT